MRHYKKGRKLGTDASHTKAIKQSLLKNLFINDRIKTTESRAKEVRGDVDKVVTWAKRGDLHSRRLAIKLVGDSELVREVFEKAEQHMWDSRDGGYCRILKLGPRKGDNAPMVILELIGDIIVKKEKKKSTKLEDAATETEKLEAADETAKDVVESEEFEDETVDEVAEDPTNDSADEAASEDADSDSADAEASDEAEEAPVEDVAEDADAEQGEDEVAEDFSADEEASEDADEAPAEDAPAEDADEAPAEDAPAEDAEESVN